MVYLVHGVNLLLYVRAMNVAVCSNPMVEFQSAEYKCDGTHNLYLAVGVLNMMNLLSEPTDTTNPFLIYFDILKT